MDAFVRWIKLRFDGNGLSFLAACFALIAVGSLAGLIMAMQHGIWIGIGVGIEVFVAAFAVGGALGFIFAVPRVLSQGQDSKAAATAAAADPALKARLQSNTNLERISDWLATMLVGVGLSQLGNINKALVEFREYIAMIAPCAAGNCALPVAAPLILITGVISGFIAMYLHTRVDLVRLFDDVEIALSRGERRTVIAAARSAEQEGAELSKQFTPSEALTLADALDLMFDLLYRPKGYKRVIALSDSLAGSAATRDADYWFYRAAAFGQQMMKDKDMREQSRKLALEAARNAVQINGNYRSRLWSISNPESSDDDLSLLRDDPEFLALVRKS